MLALRFGVLKGVIDEIADPLTGKLVVVPSNPVGIDAQGNLTRLLPEEQSSGEVVAGWLPAGARLAMAFGSMSADLFASSSNRSPERAVLFYATDADRASEQVERLIRAAGFEPVRVGGIEQSGRLEVGGDLHDLVVGPAEARSLIGRSLIASPPWLGIGGVGGVALLPQPRCCYVGFRRGRNRGRQLGRHGERRVPVDARFLRQPRSWLLPDL